MFHVASKLNFEIIIYLNVRYQICAGRNVVPATTMC